MNTALALTPTQDATLIADWLSEHARSDNTRRAYQRHVARFFAYTNKPIRQVTVHDARKWAMSLQGRPASRAQAIASLRSLFDFAMGIGYLPLSVMAAVKVPKAVHNPAFRAIAGDDLRRLLNAPQDAQEKLALQLLFVVGLRREEVARIRLCDLIRGQTGYFLRVQGKGEGENAAFVPCHPTIWRAAETLAQTHLPTQDTRPLLTLSQWAIYRLVRRTARHAHITRLDGGRVTPHTGRHTLASLAFAHGADIATVQHQLRHKSLHTTSIYTHALPGKAAFDYLPL